MSPEELPGSASPRGIRRFLSCMHPFVRRSLGWVVLGAVGGLLMNVLVSAVPVTLGRALTETFDTVVMMVVAFGVLISYDLRLTLISAFPALLVIDQDSGRTEKPSFRAAVLSL